jgi:predicted component of type VI protein secretion system
MSEELIEALRPHFQRIADWIVENLPRIEAAIQQAAEEFAADVESWLAATTARNEARNRARSDEQPADDQLRAGDDGEGP